MGHVGFQMQMKRLCQSVSQELFVIENKSSVTAVNVKSITNCGFWERASLCVLVIWLEIC